MINSWLENGTLIPVCLTCQFWVTPKRFALHYHIKPQGGARSLITETSA